MNPKDYISASSSVTEDIESAVAFEPSSVVHSLSDGSLLYRGASQDAILPSRFSRLKEKLHKGVDKLAAPVRLAKDLAAGLHTTLRAGLAFSALLAAPAVLAQITPQDAIRVYSPTATTVTQININNPDDFNTLKGIGPDDPTAIGFSSPDEVSQEQNAFFLAAVMSEYDKAQTNTKPFDMSEVILKWELADKTPAGLQQAFPEIAKKWPVARNIVARHKWLGAEPKVVEVAKVSEETPKEIATAYNISATRAAADDEEIELVNTKPTPPSLQNGPRLRQLALKEADKYRYSQLPIRATTPELKRINKAYEKIHKERFIIQNISFQIRGMTQNPEKYTEPQKNIDKYHEYQQAYEAFLAREVTATLKSVEKLLTDPEDIALIQQALKDHKANLRKTQR